NGEIIITVDGDDIVPKKEKTPANIQDFQRRFDRYLSDYIFKLSGKEKEDALSTPVFACVALYEDKLKCSKLNFAEISGAVSASMSTYNKLLVRMASAFASNEPEKIKGGQAGLRRRTRFDCQGHKVAQAGMVLVYIQQKHV
ncbi:MAG: hypothetical protein KBS59_03200, partial [Clostridiales bacterium]|nr:hypothetical protein [Clostridiales bacterium]